MGGLSLASTMAVLLLLLLLPLAYAQFHSTLGVHPTGVSYSNRSPQVLHGHGLAVHYGVGKREAEPFYAGHRLIGTSGQRQPRGQRGQRTGTTVPGIITTVEEARNGFRRLPIPLNQGKSPAGLDTMIFGGAIYLHQNYLARCGGGSISANKQI